MVGSNTLSDEQIQKLLSSSVEDKINITSKIAKYYQAVSKDDAQIKIAEQVFRALLKDSEIQVRRNLAQQIKNIPDIPHDVLLELAKDVEEVSLPLLEFSESLWDSDLIGIISSTENEQRHLAIAHRNRVNENVSEALIDTRNEKVVGNLMQNENAIISESGYEKAVTNHSNSEFVLGSMIERGTLPVVVIDKITKTISQELYSKISDKHKSAIKQLEDSVKKGQEVSVVKVMGLKSSEESYIEFIALMQKLNISERMTPIAALCIGNINLFEIITARLIKIPVINIRELLKDPQNKGFKAIYGKSGLPSNLYEVSEMLMEVLRESDDVLSSKQNLKLSITDANSIIERLVFKASEEGRPENLEYMLSLIKNISSN